ncbi:unnamed protein product [Rangifer tarandus platyrhynchus]|uniref:Uncharacterized protein n=2 Tax=Rangifer tarandus platyrhynchus TaxID=3082113 RepID=A0AC59ZR94_RANTA|nr:unnamed protein product [Rangifer tarandus platyrhynchus]
MGWRFGEETERLALRSVPGSKSDSASLVLQHGYSSNESPIIPQSDQLWSLCAPGHPSSGLGNCLFLLMDSVKLSGVGYPQNSFSPRFALLYLGMRDSPRLLSISAHHHHPAFN